MFVITGGGTGGHLAIAKSLAVELKARKQHIIYIGSLQGQDRDWFEKSDLFDAVYFLDTTGVVNKRGIGFLKALFLQVKALLKVRKIFNQYQITSVISVGGFSAGPASIGAVLFRKKLFIHEQNAIKGKLNAKLTPFAINIFGSFDDKAKNFIKTSYPVRREFFLESRERKEIKTIIFLGGSQGAVAINDFALKVVFELLDQGFEIIHQCGTKDLERMRQEYMRLGILEKITLFDFDANILSKITKADLCVCRAGASSVWELAANGIPCLYIPYPHAAGNHQYYNALFFEKMDLGVIVEQEYLDANKLFDFIKTMKAEIATVSKRLQNSIQNDGAKEIVQHIIENSLQA
ncbi:MULTISPECIES: undecaprenyldiphospho-muramoylpentapeptide beta-N-acetylglucosaminyltransferase [unclassified Helicobacter]|uniref:undecaprenyldiphospho-muramoylpentapeptide beta-N-acetylglucosaminyltransferase n=1 Tax=unclassified Helicobacter TaxID=2593540 RepID=UPI000CF117DF|nr:MULTISPECIES: undecaprenyldiphospho-muramoylpentapeptide beta-N-acetylglucosaminyltransferase [unclassified Helicobacter]